MSTTFSSAYPDGWTFSQVKAIAQDIGTRDVPAILAWAPFRFGFSPPPWQWAVNTMIKKTDNNFNVEKLRVIALLDSLFNFNNKMYGRQIMKYAELNNLVAQQQFGSRKVKECIDQIDAQQSLYQ